VKNNKPCHSNHKQKSSTVPQLNLLTQETGRSFDTCSGSIKKLSDYALASSWLRRWALLLWSKPVCEAIYMRVKNEFNEQIEEYRGKAKRFMEWMRIKHAEHKNNVGREYKQSLKSLPSVGSKRLTCSSEPVSLI